jgi:hypothetical protein
MSSVSLTHGTPSLQMAASAVFEPSEELRIGGLYRHQGRWHRQNDDEEANVPWRRRWHKPVGTCSTRAVTAVVMLLRATSGFCSRVGIYSSALVVGYGYVTVHLVTAWHANLQKINKTQITINYYSSIALLSVLTFPSKKTQQRGIFINDTGSSLWQEFPFSINLASLKYFNTRVWRWIASPLDKILHKIAWYWLDHFSISHIWHARYFTLLGAQFPGAWPGCGNRDKNCARASNQAVIVSQCWLYYRFT